MSAPTDPLLGRTIANKYAIESLIGQGAMGSVYTARHVTLDSLVAVKVLHSDLANDAAFAERFHREAKSASRLHHPNVIRVIDFGRETDGLFYIAMEYVNGVDLFQLLQREWPLNDRRSTEIMCQILSGIAAAHDIGIIHRDLKPENIIVTRGIDDEGRDQDIVKVCDFGIAKIEEHEAAPVPDGSERNLTTRGILLGTPQYMSPEQCRGDSLDARSDLYSVGIILYQLLSGRLPFVAATTVDVVIKHVTEAPIPPSRIYPNVSPGLERVCLRALEKLPDARYANAREMRNDLRQLLDRPSMFSSIDAPHSRAPGARAALPSPLPQAFAAPTLEQPQVPPVAERVTAPRGRFGSVWTYLVALSLLTGALSVLWFRKKPDAGVVSSASHAAAARPPESSGAPDPAAEAAHADQDPHSSSAPASSAESKKGKAVHRFASSVDRIPVALLRQNEQNPGSPAAALPEPGHEEAKPASGPSESPTPPGPVGVAAPDPAPAPVPPPTVSSMNPDKGHVTWKVSAVGGGATSGGVVRALSRAASSWTSCYRSGLRARGRIVEGSALLRLTCDDQGRVIHSELSGFDMPDVSACIRSSTAGATIPNADTGEAWATVALRFTTRD